VRRTHRTIHHADRQTSTKHTKTGHGPAEKKSEYNLTHNSAKIPQTTPKSLPTQRSTVDRLRSSVELLREAIHGKQGTIKMLRKKNSVVKSFKQHFVDILFIKHDNTRSNEPNQKSAESSKNK
jgi:hypothetical protein